MGGVAEQKDPKLTSSHRFNQIKSEPEQTTQKRTQANSTTKCREKATSKRGGRARTQRLGGNLNSEGLPLKGGVTGMEKGEKQTSTSGIL